jgi:hypothetical protein
MLDKKRTIIVMAVFGIFFYVRTFLLAYSWYVHTTPIRPSEVGFVYLHFGSGLIALTFGLVWVLHRFVASGPSTKEQSERIARLEAQVASLTAQLGPPST